MRKLSNKTREVLENDPRMKVCCLKDYIKHDCSKKIEWHHNLIYASKQSDIPNTILAICSDMHIEADISDVKEILDWIMLNQMTEQDFSLVPKANLKVKRELLNKKYGSYKN